MAPVITNTNFDVLPDEPFTLYLIGCDQGCTIVLLSGPSKDLEDVETLTSKLLSYADMMETLRLSSDSC